MFGAFLGGAADGAGKELEGQQDRAFKLKLQNAQIESQVAAAEEAERRRSVNSGTATEINRLLGIKGEDVSKGMSGSDTEARMGLIKGQNFLARGNGRGGPKYDRQALIESVLKNPVAYNDLTATTKADIFPDLQRSGFKRLDKALGGDLQVRADNATSGLDAIERVNMKIKQGGNDFAQIYAPGQVGAKELRTDLMEITDVIKRIRSGAATNGNEDQVYEAQVMQNGVTDLLNDLLDGSVDPKMIDYSLNTVYKPYLTRMSSMQERRRTETVDQPKDVGGLTPQKISAERARRQGLKEANKPKQGQ